MLYSVLVSNLSSEIMTSSITLKSVSQWACLVCPVQVETGRPLIGLPPLAYTRHHAALPWLPGPGTLAYLILQSPEAGKEQAKRHGKVNLAPLSSL